MEEIRPDYQLSPNKESTKKNFGYKLNFHGSGGEYFKIIIVNWLLTLVTLGIYYPWARAKKIKYIYGSTSFNEDRFSFQGLGIEMFIGLLKLFLVYFLIMGIYMIFAFRQMYILGFVFLYIFMLAIVPLAIHGSYRYRMSRTSWRGIRFGYRGDRKELILNFIKWMFLTFITLGIYSAWATINLRKFIMKNLRFGNVECKYTGEGSELFLINLKGILLSLITLGIYSFWWQKDIFNYYIDKTILYKENEEIRLKSTATGGGFFKLLILNLLIVIFTLGLGAAWAEVRIMKFITEHITFEGNIDLDNVYQTEEEYNDAMGESAADFFDIDLF